MSRTEYCQPCLKHSNTELTKVNFLICKVYKSDIQTPHSTSTDRLEQLGIHNTAEELIEAQRLNQLARLSASPTGQQTMHSLNLRAPLITARVPVPQDIHAQLLIRPLPRNMHPVHNQKRSETTSPNFTL